MRGARCAAVSSALLAVVAAISVSAPAECAANWPMWMENPAHTPTPQFEPTAPLTTAWEVPCSGIFGSPVVYEGVVYFGDRHGWVWAVDAASGDRLWVASTSKFDVEPVEGMVMSHADLVASLGLAPAVIATPAVDANYVYVGNLGGRFHARNRVTGELAWEQDLDEPIASSPVLTEELLVVGTRGGSVVAMNPADGWVKWTCWVDGRMNSSPALAEGKVVIGTQSGVIAIAADSGQLVWQQQFQDQTKVDSSPCIVDDRVYAASWRGAVGCLSLGEGQMLWERTVDRYPIFASPTVAGGMVYVATTGGLLTALNAETGETVWETDIWWRGRTAAYASPVVCGSAVLVGSNARRVHVFDAQTGNRLTDIGMDLGSFVHGTPVVTDEGLYVSSEAHPSADAGWVVKFSCQPQRTTVTGWDFRTIVCWELGLLDGEATEERGEHVGWRVGPSPRELGDHPCSALQSLGLIRSRHEWGPGHLPRYQVAAFYYNLFWDPNPFDVQLPEFEPAELLDAGKFPAWVRNAPQLVVGLGLMEAPEGRFEGREGMTAAELRSSLRRVKELLGQGE
jgi:outer membrane protein assembly factor BamB